VRDSDGRVWAKSAVSVSGGRGGRLSVEVAELSVAVTEVAFVRCEPPLGVAGSRDDAAPPPLVGSGPLQQPRVTVRCFPGHSLPVRELSFTFASAPDATAFATLLAPLWTPRRFAVVLNEYSGKRQGRAILERAAHVFRAAQVELDVVPTTHANFGFEWASRADATAYDGIVCVSGDSTMSEVINGFAQRPNASALLAVPIGVLAAGSTNGIAREFNLLDEIVAALRMVRGTFLPLDALRLRYGHENRLLLCNVGFGLLGDLNYHAERWKCIRSCGPVRYVLGACRALCCYSGYHCRLSFVEGYAPRRWTSDEIGRLYSDVRGHRPALHTELNVAREADERGGAASEEPTDRKSDEKRDDTRVATQPLPELQSQPWVPVQAPADLVDRRSTSSRMLRTPSKVATGTVGYADEWRVMDIDVSVLFAVTFRTPFTPRAIMSDGLLDVCIIHKANCCGVLGSLLSVVLGAADRRVEVAQVRKLKLENMTPLSARLNLDGEVMEILPGETLYLEVEPASFVFLGGWD
jgi:diacylglycerol kinase family enzyme